MQFFCGFFLKKIYQGGNFIFFPGEKAAGDRRPGSLLPIEFIGIRGREGGRVLSLHKNYES